MYGHRYGYPPRWAVKAPHYQVRPEVNLLRVPEGSRVHPPAGRGGPYVGTAGRPHTGPPPGPQGHSLPGRWAAWNGPPQLVPVEEAIRPTGPPRQLVTDRPPLPPGRYRGGPPIAPAHPILRGPPPSRAGPPLWMPQPGTVPRSLLGGPLPEAVGDAFPAKPGALRLTDRVRRPPFRLPPGAIRVIGAAGAAGGLWTVYDLVRELLTPRPGEVRTRPPGGYEPPQFFVPPPYAPSGKKNWDAVKRAPALPCYPPVPLARRF